VIAGVAVSAFGQVSGASVTISGRSSASGGVPVCGDSLGAAGTQRRFGCAEIGFLSQGAGTNCTLTLRLRSGLAGLRDLEPRAQGIAL